MSNNVKLVPTPSTGLVTERDYGKKPILECINLGIEFGGLKAVDDLNLTIGPTEITGLIGPNGAGKTTVFNMLTKVYQPTHGTILLNGKDTHSMNTMQVNRAGIARTFQNIRLFNNLSVEENLKVGMDAQLHYNMVSGILRLPSYWEQEKAARPQDRFQGSCSRSRRSSRLLADDRGGKPGDGRLHPSPGHGSQSGARV